MVQLCKKVIEACGGDIKIEYTEKRFWVQVLLYLSNIVENEKEPLGSFLVPILTKKYTVFDNKRHMKRIYGML